MGRRTGKGSRKASRKRDQRKIDVSDVVEANEAHRKEERMASVPNDSLFVFDRKAEPIIVPKAKRRRLAKEKVTQIEKSAYYQTDVAPSPFNPTIRPKKTYSDKRMNEDVESRKRKRASSSPIVAETTTVVAKKGGRNTKIAKRERKPSGPQEDLWASPAPTYPSYVQKRVGKGQEKLKADQSNLGGGFSYNPVKEDHQDVLAVAVADELKKVRDIEEVEGYLATKRSVRRLSKKMDKTIPFFGARDDDDEEEVETDDDEDFPAFRPTSADPIRKTKTERNKEAKRKAERKKVQAQKKEKKIDPRASKREVDEALKQADAVQTKWDARAEFLEEAKSNISTASYNKNKIADRPMPVLLTDQLPSSLRQMPGVEHYNPITEQFVKFQKKGVIEARERKGPQRKHAPKKYKTHEYRDLMDKMGAEEEQREKAKEQRKKQQQKRK